MAVTTFEQYQALDTKPRDSSQSDASSKFDWEAHFTATGQPMPTYKPSAWTNACLWGEQAPNHPPFRYTDQSIMPVIVRVDTSVANNSRSIRRNPRFQKLKKVYRNKDKASDIKVIRMPKADYLRYFARDINNNYVGTEPEMRWTKEMLDEKFGMYQGLAPPHWVMRQSEGQPFMEQEIEGGLVRVLDGKMGLSVSHTAL